MKELQCGSYVQSPLSTAELDLREWSDRERQDRIYYSTACSTSLAETMGKRESSDAGPGRLEHHFRLSISRSPKGLLSPIAHAAVRCRRLHFGAFHARAIIDEENRPRRRVRRPARAKSSVSPAIICNSCSDCARADCRWNEFTIE